MYVYCTGGWKGRRTDEITDMHMRPSITPLDIVPGELIVSCRPKSRHTSSYSYYHIGYACHRKAIYCLV